MLILSVPEDRMVVSQLHEGFCARLEDCEMAVFSGARHELFMEAEENRQRVLWRVESILERFPREPARGNNPTGRKCART